MTVAENVLGQGAVRVSGDVEFAELWSARGRTCIVVSPSVAADPPRLRIAIARELAEWEMRNAPYSGDLEHDCCQIAAAVVMPYAATRRLLDEAGYFAPRLIAEHFEIPVEEVYDRCVGLTEPTSGVFLASTRLFGASLLEVSSA